MWAKTRLVPVICASLGVSPAFAADITRDGTIQHQGIAADGIIPRFDKVSLRGKIVSGDLARLRKVISREDSAVVSLNSTGGDYQEGLAIANFLRDLHIRTIVEDGATCLSACAIAFLGGAELQLEGFEPGYEISMDAAVIPARSLGQTARLGFHAPFLNMPQAEFTKERIEASYDHAIKTVTDFVRTTRRFRIEPEVAADMMTPQRSQLYFVDTVRELARVGVEVENVPAPPSLTISMVRNLCVNAYAWSSLSYGRSVPEIETEMRDAVKDTEWREDIATIPLEIESFGPGLKVKRTVWPTYYAAEGGYYFCVVDHTRERGRVRASLIGYVFDDGYGSNAFSFGLSADDMDDEPDVPAGISVGRPPLSEPASLDARSPEDSWALVPETTQLAEIAATLEYYLKTEKPL